MTASQHSSIHDPATRERLIQAATRLFAEHGYKATAVREICQAAGANVAAINYHFQSKLGLYKEVVRRVADQMETGKTDLIPEDRRLSPEDRLRAYIRTFLGRLLAERSEIWMDQILGREMSDPSPALDLIIERAIKPNAERLGALVAELLGRPAADDQVWKCTVSIQAQCLFYYNSRPVFARMNRNLRFTPEVIDDIARHVAEFSLAGIRHFAQQKP